MEFAQGYGVGFDQATSIVAHWGHKMNDPAARNAIAEVVKHLQQVRLRITSESPEMSIRPVATAGDP
jgi:hypothetical protein